LFLKLYWRHQQRKAQEQSNGMAEKEAEREQSMAGHEETATVPSPLPSDEVATADWRVQAAVKDRWHTIKANPKILFIALFAS
jgi:hypothetical protein